jgi:hypothetical protein
MFKTGVVIFLMVVIGPLARAEEAISAVSTSMSALRAQMEVERGKQQELQLLQLEVDRLKLEVEKKKTVVELGQIEGSGRLAGSPLLPDTRSLISLRYVFIAPGRREAVLDIDGAERRVQEGQDAGGRVVKAISAEGVSLKEKDGSETFLDAVR